METIQMNKLITSSTDEKTDEIDEILQDAENIILASNGVAKKHIKNKSLIIFAIVIAVLAVLLLVFSTVFALININSNKIMNGVFIQGIDVSNLTIDEAKEKVSGIVNKHLACKIVVKRDDFEGVFMPEQLGVTFDVDSVVNEAYMIGRNSNIFENNYSILNCLLNNYSISANINFDDDYLSSVISEIN
jgi:VanW family protein